MADGEMNMCILDTINAKRDEVRRLASRYNGRSVYVFGSCARREESPESDIDFLVDFGPGATLFGMSDLKDGLQMLFNRSVDLITEKSLKRDSFGDRVRAERIAI